MEAGHISGLGCISFRVYDETKGSFHPEDSMLFTLFIPCLLDVVLTKLWKIKRVSNRSGPCLPVVSIVPLVWVTLYGPKHKISKLLKPKQNYNI